eukprot:6171070-Amphidinium_carterae.1
MGTAEHVTSGAYTTHSATYWADFAKRVYHFWGLVGPLLRERPESELRVRLPPEVPDETLDVGILGMAFLESSTCGSTQDLPALF